MVFTGVSRTKSPGHPSQLIPTQQADLAILLDKGAVNAGFRGADWRSPRIQPLMHDRFGVFPTVISSAPWLKPLGVS
jgi:hypothetical protein